jgi:hypothetical protein
MKILCYAVRILIFSLLFLISITTSAWSESANNKFDLKITGGLTYLEVGDWNAHHLGWNESRRMDVEAAGGTVHSETQELHWGWEISGDVIFNLNTRFAFSIGTGYINGQFADSADTTVGSVTASNIHDFKVRAIPVRAGAYYFLPVSPKARLSLGTGLGYYFAKFHRFYRRESGSGYWIDTDMTGKGGGIGFDGGVGLEYNLTKKITLVIEGYGRYAKISGFKGTQYRIDSNNWSDSLDGYYYALEQERLPYGWFTEVTIATTTPTGSDKKNVRDAEVDFSGFSIRVGLKIGLF